MAKILYDYDPSAALDSPDAFETGDASYIAKSLGVVTRAKGMTQITSETGLSREQLYRSFSDRGSPTLENNTCCYAITFLRKDFIWPRLFL